MKVAEDHGKQKAAFYAGFSVGQQEVTIDMQNTSICVTLFRTVEFVSDGSNKTNKSVKYHESELVGIILILT